MPPDPAVMLPIIVTVLENPLADAAAPIVWFDPLVIEDDPITPPVMFITPPAAITVRALVVPADGEIVPVMFSVPVEFVLNAAQDWPDPPAWFVPVTVRVPVPLW